MEFQSQDFYKSRFSYAGFYSNNNNNNDLSISELCITEMRANSNQLSTI